MLGKCLTGMLVPLEEEVGGLRVSQGCQNDCLSGMLDEVDDADAGWTV